VRLIDGSPGAGKTVLALDLRVRLTSKGLVGKKFVSKNAASYRV
jgi:broad-specificity NMP kinase